MINDCDIAKKASDWKSLENHGIEFVEGLPVISTLFEGEGSVEENRRTEKIQEKHTLYFK